MEYCSYFCWQRLNKALIRYLETRFVEIARSSKRYLVLTKNTYRNIVMKEFQMAVMEEFVDNVKILINALGYKVLEPFAQMESASTMTDDEVLSLSTGSASTSGKVKELKTTEDILFFSSSAAVDFYSWIQCERPTDLESERWSYTERY